MELPLYKCHKVVRAAKITGILINHGGHGPNSTQGGIIPHVDINLVLPNGKASSVRKDMNWYEKHQPKQGGYYVVYNEGYSSYSPAKAFEEGYTLTER